MRLLFAGLFAVLTAQPLSAQPVARVEAPADPARVTAATAVIDRLWPLGTYRRMMDGTMSKMMDAILDSAMGMKASDIGKGGDELIGESAMKADPYFRERMKISMDTMMVEMLPLMDQVEPKVRDSLTTIYARKYSTSQLSDMSAFFATPTGAIYARESMLVYMDPEMIKAMQAFAPEMVSAMPAIVKKVEAATAHLPPLPKPKVDEDEASDRAAEAAELAMTAAADAATDAAYDPASWSKEDQATREKLNADYVAASEKLYSFDEEATARTKAKLAEKKK